MTYKRNSDLWCNYLPPVAWPSVAGAERSGLAPPLAKTESSPAVLFQSSPYDRSGRYRYLHKLMRLVRADSYRKLVLNRQVSGPDLGRNEARGHRPV